MARCAKSDDIFEVHFYGKSRHKIFHSTYAQGSRNPLGNFLKNITEKATWTFLARYGNSTEHETGTMDFCESLDSIDQPGRHGQPDCPPEKGFALIKMSAWVMPMFIVPVSIRFRWIYISGKLFCPTDGKPGRLLFQIWCHDQGEWAYLLPRCGDLSWSQGQEDLRQIN